MGPGLLLQRNCRSEWARINDLARVGSPSAAGSVRAVADLGGKGVLRLSDTAATSTTGDALSAGWKAVVVRMKVPHTSKASLIIFGIAVVLLALQFIPVSQPPKDDPGFFWWAGVVAGIGGIVGIARVIEALLRKRQRIAAAVPLLLNAGVVAVFLRFFV